MNEDEKGELPSRLLARQPQQAEPASGSIDGTLATLSERPGEVKADGGAQDDAASAALDDARFTAGVVKLYEALLKEPIPERMLRLVEELGKQERT